MTKIVKDNQWHKELAHNMAQRGMVTHKPPLGYKIAMIDGIKKAIPDPASSLYVKDLFNYYSTAVYSLDQMVEKLGQKHQIWVSRASVHKILRSKYYIGITTIKEKEYRHDFERLIPIELWEECNRILNSYRKKTTKYRGKKFLFRGCISCFNCGALYTGEQHKGINYYRCSQSKVKKDLHPDRAYLREDAAMEAVIEAVSSTKVNLSLFKDNELRARLFVSSFFSLFAARGKEVVYEVNKENSKYNWNAFLKTDGLSGSTNKKSKPIVKDLKINDPFVRFCQSGKSIDELMAHFKMDISAIQSKLMDYQLNETIEETESGLWQAI